MSPGASRRRRQPGAALRSRSCWCCSCASCCSAPASSAPSAPPLHSHLPGAMHLPAARAQLGVCCMKRRVHASLRIHVHHINRIVWRCQAYAIEGRLY